MGFLTARFSRQNFVVMLFFRQKENSSKSLTELATEDPHLPAVTSSSKLQLQF